MFSFGSPKSISRSTTKIVWWFPDPRQRRRSERALFVLEVRGSPLSVYFSAVWGGFSFTGGALYVPPRWGSFRRGAFFFPRDDARVFSLHRREKRRFPYGTPPAPGDFRCRCPPGDPQAVYERPTISPGTSKWTPPRGGTIFPFSPNWLKGRIPSKPP